MRSIQIGADGVVGQIPSSKRIFIKRLATVLATLVICSTLLAQNNNWPTYGGNAQRSGSQGTDPRLTRETVKDIQLLFKTKLEVLPKGLRPLLPPLILGRLISYRGFRELAFVGSNADIVYAIDADLGTVFWTRHLEYSTIDPQITLSTADCPGGMNATPTMPVPGVAAPRGAAPTGPARGAASPATTAFVSGQASVYAISSDGRLHRLNTSTGDDMVQPVQVLPANARTSNLNMVNNVIYTVTSPGCNETPNAVWAIDFAGDVPKASSYALTNGNARGLAGPVIGGDGTVYVAAGSTLVALTPDKLSQKGFFTLGNRAGAGDHASATSPLAFTLRNREFIVTAGKDGRLYLIDAATLATNHETPLDRTPVLAASDDGYGVFGNLSTWQEGNGTRWVLAPVWGKPSPELKVPGTNGTVSNGFIGAFKVEEQAGKMTLTPAWLSRDMSSPLPPVVMNGVVFALSAGEFTRQTRDGVVDERPKPSSRATFFAFDIATGKELYSSRNLIASPASLSGLTLANGRIYFGGIDGTFYAFGMYMER